MFKYYFSELHDLHALNWFWLFIPALSFLIHIHLWLIFWCLLYVCVTCIWCYFLILFRVHSMYTEYGECTRSTGHNHIKPPLNLTSITSTSLSLRVGSFNFFFCILTSWLNLSIISVLCPLLVRFIYLFALPQKKTEYRDRTQGI